MQLKKKLGKTEICVGVNEIKRFSEFKERNFNKIVKESQQQQKQICRSNFDASKHHFQQLKQNQNYQELLNNSRNISSNFAR